MKKYSTTDTNNKIYRWMTLEICAKNLAHGLGFGDVTQYVDKSEFSARIKDPKRRDLLKNLDRPYIGNKALKETFENATRKVLTPQLNELAQSRKAEDIFKELSEHYYVCSLTDNPSEVYSWSDKEERKPHGRFCINCALFNQDLDYKVGHVKYELNLPKINIFDMSLRTVDRIVFNKLIEYENEQEVRALLNTDILKNIEKGVLHERDKEYPYIYDKRLHEYLEAILIPKEMREMEGASEGIEKIKQQLYASGNVEEQLRLCKCLKESTLELGMKESLPFFEDINSKRQSRTYQYPAYLSLFRYYNLLHCHQLHSTICEMLSVLDEGVNVDTRLEELAKRPKYGKVDLI